MENKAGEMVGTLVMMASQALWAPWFPGEEREDSASSRLARYLGKKRNYRKVKRAVARLRSRNPHHMCVAFVALALRRAGVDMPGDERFDGLAVTRISLALSRCLESMLGWRRIREPSQLQPGDVVFTGDAPCCPGLPDHVYVFMGWRDRARLIADVADDRRFVRARPLYPEKAASAAFEYALRAPVPDAAEPLAQAA